VLELAGLGNAWRAAHEVGQMPAVAGEAHHPVQCCFIGLAGVSPIGRAALFKALGRETPPQPVLA
jgi:hypothetical protein